MIPQKDLDFLSTKGYVFELLPESGHIHLVLKDFPFPSEFYTPNKADLLIRIPQGYPMTPLDMFWVSPKVVFLNGNAAAATIEKESNWHQKEWQRWSRHYEWRPGVDSIKTHITAIINELKKGT